jgi:hypothetical protein
MSDEMDYVCVNDDNTEEDLPFYDAENVNDNNNIIADKANNDNDMIEPKHILNDLNEPNDAFVLVDNSNDVETSNNNDEEVVVVDNEEVVVVTDGSIITAPSNASKKKQKHIINNTSPF